MCYGPGRPRWTPYPPTAPNPMLVQLPMNFCLPVRVLLLNHTHGLAMLASVLLLASAKVFGQNSGGAALTLALAADS